MLKLHTYLTIPGYQLLSALYKEQGNTNITTGIT